MCRWQAVIFDLDDTLYPEREYVLSGFRAVAAWAEGALGIPRAPGYAQLTQFFADGVRGNTFNLWLTMYGQPETLVPTLVEVYRQHSPALTPHPGARSLLASLRRYGSVGLVSDGYRDVQQRKLDALNLAPAFDAVVFSDTYGRSHWKPSVRPFVAVTTQLGVERSCAVYVGDNPLKDFLGARRAGLRTVWLRHAGGEYIHRLPPTTAHAADVTVGSFAALADLLIGRSVREIAPVRGSDAQLVGM